jgi:hypothetical protein
MRRQDAGADARKGARRARAREGPASIGEKYAVRESRSIIDAAGTRETSRSKAVTAGAAAQTTTERYRCVSLMGGVWWCNQRRSDLT